MGTCLVSEGCDDSMELKNSKNEPDIMLIWVSGTSKMPAAGLGLSKNIRDTTVSGEDLSRSKARVENRK